MWEIYTGGLMPYGGMSNPQVVEQVVKGFRLNQPQACSDDVFQIMQSTWNRVRIK